MLKDIALSSPPPITIFNGGEFRGEINGLCRLWLWQKLQGALDKVPLFGQRRLFCNQNNSILPTLLSLSAGLLFYD